MLRLWVVNEIKIQHLENNEYPLNDIELFAV